MNENGNKTNNMNNMKYVFILIGVLALLASYFLVFTKYSTKNDEISDEIKVLKEDRDRLVDMNNNKGGIEKKTKEVNEMVNQELGKYDGGLSYKAEIIDAYNITQDVENQITKMDFKDNQTEEENYTFGQITSANPNGYSGDMTKYTSEKMSYSITTVSNYDQIKKTLKKVSDASGKRKVIKSISIKAGNEPDKIQMDLSVTEYAITGEGREPYIVVIPNYLESNENIFFNSIIVR